jgi:hypothetical protein
MEAPVQKTWQADFAMPDSRLVKAARDIQYTAYYSA